MIACFMVKPRLFEALSDRHVELNGSGECVGSSIRESCERGDATVSLWFQVYGGISRFLALLLHTRGDIRLEAARHNESTPSVPCLR